VIDHPVDVLAGSTITNVRETTVKAFSMAMGVRHPGYHLLSLYPPTADSPASGGFTQTNCVLPDQIGIWLNVYLPGFVVLVFALFLPKVYRHYTTTLRRSAATARSNGLPVHTHTRSLSRSLFLGPPKDDFADLAAAEDQDSQFPTFPFSPSVGMDHSYHSGLSGDELPTLANGRYRNDSDEEMADIPAGRVRRVSRVWAWEGAGAGRGSPFGGEEGVSLTGRQRGSRGVWGRIGGAFRPVTRAMRRSWVRRMLVGGLARVAGKVLGGTVGELVKDTLGEVVQVIGWGVGWWAVLFWWFG